MVIIRTPLRISFLGGGSDLPAFYNRSVGRVISAAIDKYIFIAINEKFDEQFRIGYSVTEIVDRPELIQNTRVRAVLKHFKITKGLEIVSMADVPSKGTGLGSSSSFAVGLVHGLSRFFDKKIHFDKQTLAESACHLELNILKESIGKQDQYAAAFGGLNLMEFHPKKVLVQPVDLSAFRLADFQKHLLLFYTGVNRSKSAAENSRILTKNLTTDEKKFSIQKQLVDLVSSFQTKLIKGDWRALGEILHQGWLLKKKTSSAISNNLIDELYDLGLKNGAWGGKLLGAGGGGFLLFLAPFNKQTKIRKTFGKLRELKVGFDQEGSKVIFDRRAI